MSAGIERRRARAEGTTARRLREAMNEVFTRDSKDDTFRFLEMPQQGMGLLGGATEARWRVVSL
jgi:hypothetical protein